MKTFFYTIFIYWMSCIFIACAPTPNGSFGTSQNGLTRNPHPTSPNQTEPQNSHIVVKTKKINDVLTHIDQETLLVFDVDATILWVPGHNWPYEPAIHKIDLAEGNNTRTTWASLMADTTNKTTQPGPKMIFLTARYKPHDPSDNVIENLKTANLNGYQTDWIAGQFDPGRFYKNGVLYTGGKDKGPILVQFLQKAQTKYPIKKVIFVDDRKNNVDNVHQALKNSAAVQSSISFWYQGAIHPETGKTVGILIRPYLLWPYGAAVNMVSRNLVPSVSSSRFFSSLKANSSAINAITLGSARRAA
jgi:hypothetical protein